MPFGIRVPGSKSKHNKGKKRDEAYDMFLCGRRRADIRIGRNVRGGGLGQPAFGAKDILQSDAAAGDSG
jgi:hypothetical protein